ncbi:hypothetical protein AQUCO_03800064v1 [Aquilegia coerulea]|uniref:Protein kinase domain-containing protein n=1 Tax=Aquilegia coerulea TaxID=218851 RepID=A0A2G5CSE1_AQUCA|nr:hypothetical protein AQUCO_03800064v1 [Aquilegia coerulea]
MLIIVSIGLINRFNGNDPQTVTENVDVDANAAGQVQLVEQEVAGDLQENVDIDANAAGQVQLVEQEVAGDLQGALATDVDVNAAEEVQLVEQEVAGELQESVEVGTSSSFAVDYLEIAWTDLQFDNIPLVGEGAFGDVRKATWHESEVAVKVMKKEIQDSEIKKFQTEVSIMKSARHPNIVQFMGVVSRFPHPAIVTEFVSGGSLHDKIKTRRLSQGRRLSIALDVARGMNYLHCFKPPIVHLDLKSPNILLDSHLGAKICDFGLARFRAGTFIPSKYVAGTPKWSAPEAFKDEPANEKADVYSFGVILWELVTWKEPWSGYDPHQVITAVSLLNERLAIPANTCPELVSLMESCWKESPEERPTAELIVRTLHDHQRESGNLTIQ